MSKLFTTVLPSLLIGGLLFGTAFTEAQPAPPTPPTAPTPPTPPNVKTPKPPKAPKIKGQIHIDVGDLDDMVDEQIQNALEAIGDNDQIPAHVREALKQRLEKVRIKVKTKLSKINPSDLDDVKVELGQMGDEIGQEMEQFGKEMEKWSKDFEKKMEKQVEAQVKQHKKMQGAFDKWKGPMIADNDDDHDLPGAVDMDDMDDSADLDDAMKNMGGFKLDDTQKQKLKRLRQESDAKVENAKNELDQASEKLRTLIESDGATEQNISEAIDRVTKAEGAIRKARIVAWVKARQVLDGSQRQKIQHARGK